MHGYQLSTGSYQLSTGRTTVSETALNQIFLYLGYLMWVERDVYEFEVDDFPIPITGSSKSLCGSI